MADIEQGRQIDPNETKGISRRTFLKTFTGGSAVMFVGGSIDFYNTNNAINERRRVLRQAHPTLPESEIDQQLLWKKRRLWVDLAIFTYGAMATCYGAGALSSENAIKKAEQRRLRQFEARDQIYPSHKK